ncbi:MAG: MOSC domain-containing protein [Methylocella sp.]
MSSIFKGPIAGPWRITPTGLQGDVQADPEHHGGRDMALHHYPRDHFAAWIAETPELAEPLARAPGFGENISMLGLTEADVCIGDSMRVGEVILQVSQGRTGWYYRVLKEGAIVQGDRFEIIDRLYPEWPLSRINDLLYHRTKAYDELAALTELPELAAEWRKLAARRVSSRSVESWSGRLEGA